MRSKILIAVCSVTALVWAGLDGSYVLPLDHPAIEYAKAPVDDALEKLQKTIGAGESRLDYHADLGYLPAVLRELKIPVSSQVLVFSKTSFQAARISPRAPRALYFNDDISVGYVKGGDVLEFVVADPKQGAIFYTLDQERVEKPSFSRQDQCLQCHASGSTLGVPGLLVRSVYPDRTGMPIFQAGSFITDHRSPLKERWGGWYVTGTHGKQVHMGNSVAQSESANNLVSLDSKFDTGAYLTPHSDIVALMILEHQTRMHNMLTRVGYETRVALHDQEAMNTALSEPAGTVSESTRRRINNAVEELVKYMLFTDEWLLTDEVKGTSGFAEEYAKRRPADSKGRSLRQLDLKRRLLKYPCSPLIYSHAFDGLPDAARARTYSRLAEVLTGKDTSPVFARLTSDDRTAIREILLDTKPEFSSYVK